MGLGLGFTCIFTYFPLWLWTQGRKGRTGIVVACDVYLLECCEGNLDPSWKVMKLPFKVFFKRAMKGGMLLDPTAQKR